jgi:Domain of unknown function (DUF4266)
MQRSKPPVLVFIALSAVILTTTCRTVKPYQRAYLNDYNMQLGKSGIDKFDQSVQTYKEGASGGGNGKPSGGCGCN